MPQIDPLTDSLYLTTVRKVSPCEDVLSIAEIGRVSAAPPRGLFLGKPALQLGKLSPIIRVASSIRVLWPTLLGRE